MVDGIVGRWTNEPKEGFVGRGRIEIITEPHTDLWQKTFGVTSLDNAPMFQWSTDAPEFVFSAKANFDSKGLYDQCGIVLHMDGNTWLKASMESEDGVKHLGSVVTNNGYSDWSAVDVSPEKKIMWYRMTRKNDDFTIEYSEDGETYSVLRMCHLWNLEKTVNFGVYACSPRDSSFKAVFTHMEFRTL